MTTPITLPLVDGRYQVPFGYGAGSRVSGAWSPDDGRAYRANVGRVTPGRIPVNSWRPAPYYTFAPGTVAMTYDTGPNTLVARETAFEAAFPEFTKVTLGSSSQARSIFAYRLGPTSRKHFIVVGGVHGTEVDGIDGLFKAMEVLARGGFADFLLEWTVLFIPTMNPDGWKLGTKRLAQVGPNGQTVNLDRNWNWYWTEYVEATESKGASPGSSTEATALLNYAATGNSGGPVTIGCVLDFHANDGVGARYQSRDQVLRTVGTIVSDAIPYGSLTLNLDSHIWRLVSVAQTRRALTGGSERFTRRLRSRFRPSLTGYFASTGAFTLQVASVKVGSSSGRETIASASNFWLDYVLATAAACTLGRWSSRDGLLLEPAATNLIANADFRDWTGLAGSSPTGFNPGRGSIVKSTPFIAHGGNAAKLTATVNLRLTDGAGEYTSACAAGFGAVIGLVGTKVYRVPANDRTSGLQITLATHTTPFAAALIYAGAGIVDILGGGTSAYTGATTTQTRLTTTAGAFAEAAGAGNIGTARMHAGFCDNLFASPSGANIRGYLAGGVNGVGTRLSSLGIWNPTTTTFTAEAFSLPTAVAGPLAVFFPPNGKVYVFGGESASTHLNTIHAWTPGVSVVSTGLTLTKLLAFMAGAYSPVDQCIYVYGGEDENSVESAVVYKFDPVAATITVITPRGNLADDEALCDTGDLGGFWAQPVGRWAGATLAEAANDRGATVIFGGRLTNSAGALQDAIFVHRPDADALNEARYVLGSFFRYSAVTDTPYVTLLTDAFGAGLGNWTDPDGAWGITGGKAQAVAIGPLIMVPVATQPMESIVCSIAMSGAGVMPDSGVALRAVFSGSTLLDGYRIRFSNTGAETWFVERLNGGVVTGLSSLNVAADSTKQLSTSLRTLSIFVEDVEAVKITVIFNGFTLFTVYDAVTTRITATGKVALLGGTF